MIKLAVLFLLLCSPAMAQEKHNWNDTFVVVESIDVGYSVTFHNEISAMYTNSPFNLVIDGVKVDGMYLGQPASVPDDIVVYPPDGFWCDPCQISVGEGAEGSIILYKEAGV